MPDNVYRERARLVAFLAELFETTTWIDPNWPEFRVVAVETPLGQMSWHIHPDDMDLFDDDLTEGEWDGHTTEEKYDRLTALGKDFWWLYG